MLEMDLIKLPKFFHVSTSSTLAKLIFNSYIPRILLPKATPIKFK
jgi:hypothetical protein